MRNIYILLILAFAFSQPESDRCDPVSECGSGCGTCCYDDGSSDTMYNEAACDYSNGTFYLCQDESICENSSEDCPDGYVELWGECYSIENTITLDLFDTGISGEIPPQIGDLINVGYINLGYNSLSGTIPDEMQNLNNLTICITQFSFAN